MNDEDEQEDEEEEMVGDAPGSGREPGSTSHIIRWSLACFLAIALGVVVYVEGIIDPAVSGLGVVTIWNSVPVFTALGMILSDNPPTDRTGRWAIYGFSVLVGSLTLLAHIAFTPGVIFFVVPIFVMVGGGVGAAAGAVIAKFWGKSDL